MDDWHLSNADYLFFFLLTNANKKKNKFEGKNKMGRIRNYQEMRKRNISLGSQKWKKAAKSKGPKGNSCVFLSSDSDFDR